MAARHPILLLVLAALGWSLGGLLIRSVHWNSMAIASVRGAIAAITILIACPRPRFTFSKTQVLGAIFYCATVVSFVAATKLTSAANAIFLQYTAPVFIALMSARVLGEKPAKLDWLLMAVTQGGICLFFLDQLSFTESWGNILALFSGLCYATLAVLLRKQKDTTPIESILLGNILTALVGLPFVFSGSPGTEGWVRLVLLGVFQLGLPYVLFAMAIRHVKALEASLIGMLEPVLNPLWVSLMLGEHPKPWALVGGCIVLGAAATRGIVTALRKQPTT